MRRPLMQQGVGQLEALFAKSKADVRLLKQLEHELQYRQVPRAVALLAEVQAAMHNASPSTPAAPPDLLVPIPQQATLLEGQSVSAGATIPTKEPEPLSVSKSPRLAAEVMSLEDAYKLLKATASSTWESIEQTRRQLVQQAYPARLKSMSTERRAQALADAKKVNVAYAALCQARCAGR